MPYGLEYTKAAERFIRKLDSATQRRVLAKLESLAVAPRGMGAVKLSGQDAYRVRVGDYRIIYAVFDDRMVVLVVDIGNRKDVYRGW
jgi:mRNA interferase RelE/StbE